MYIRPASCEEGIRILRKAIERTQSYKNINVYTVYWNAGNYLINGSWGDNMLKPLCATSDVTSFLFKTACPVIEELLCNPYDAETNIDNALKNEKTPQYVQETYMLLQELIESANKALLRTDVQDDLKRCAEEVLKMMDNTQVCESIRLLSMGSMKTRICIRIGIPRMIHSFLNDTNLQQEKMNGDILKQLVFTE